MISIQITGSQDLRSFAVSLSGIIDPEKMLELNQALAIRMRRELKDHFVAKNAQPNKRGWRKSNFWNQIADATDIGEVTASSATVNVADQRYNIHLFGGTILPKNARSLTIPIIEEAAGLRAKDYEINSGRRLFTIPGRNVLFEKTDTAARESLVNRTKGKVRGKNRSFTVNLAARTGIRAVYALAKKARIDRDPTAFPATETIVQALQEEADDFLEDLREEWAAL